MKRLAFILMIGSCVGLLAQVRQADATHFATRDHHEGDISDFSDPAILGFNPFEQNDIQISQTGMAIISKYIYGVQEGEFTILPFPGPAEESQFQIQAIAPDGEKAWTYTYEKDFIWAADINRIVGGFN